MPKSLIQAVRTWPGVDFTIILRAAFTQANPKSAKKTVRSSSFFALLGSVSLKAVHKHIDEIDPRLHQMDILLKRKLFTVHEGE